MVLSSSVTQLIHRAQHGDAAASDALYAEMYRELEKLARSRLRARNRPTRLETGSLAHESFLRFAAADQPRFESRVHFIRWAARVMRSVIVDFARRRSADRRGGGSVRVAMDVEHAVADDGEEEILAVHQALERIATVEPRLTQIVEMRYFAGMTEPEIAASLGVTERTIRRDWQKARLLLREALA